MMMSCPLCVGHHPTCRMMSCPIWALDCSDRLIRLMLIFLDCVISMTIIEVIVVSPIMCGLTLVSQVTAELGILEVFIQGAQLRRGGLLVNPLMDPGGAHTYHATHFSW